eukprot:356647-Chlamydomonas_euryale.AAC.5
MTAASWHRCRAAQRGDNRSLPTPPEQTPAQAIDQLALHPIASAHASVTAAARRPPPLPPLSPPAATGACAHWSCSPGAAAGTSVLGTGKLCPCPRSPAPRGGARTPPIY